MQNKTEDIKINMNFKDALWENCKTFYLIVWTQCYFVSVGFWMDFVGFIYNWPVWWLYDPNPIPICVKINWICQSPLQTIML